MASKKLSTDTSLANSYKLSRGVASVARPSAPTIGTATDGGSGLMSVTFTASTLGPTASSFALTSSSGVTGTGASSPLTLQEAVEGTYTYSVSGVNANGTGPSSAASNSVVVASVDSSAYFPIQTTTLATSAASVTFSSIPQTYTHLQVRVTSRCEAPSASVRNITSTMNSDTTNNYYRHYMLGGGSTPIAGSDGGTVIYLGSAAGTGGFANVFGVSIYDYLDYANTNKYKSVRCFFGYEDSSGGQVIFGDGLWKNTNAITSLTFTTEGNYNFSTYSTFTLYGIKG